MHFLPRLADFPQALEQSTARLRELTTRGDAAERLWSVWALALRQGRGATPELRAAIASEPNAGTRSMVATVLAGFGDATTLRSMAARDPSPLVRETACQCLARIAGGDLATIDFLLFRMTHDPSPQVRAAVALELPASAPPVAFQRCATLLQDPDPRVREAATRRLVAHARGVEHLPENAPEGGLAALAGIDPPRCLRVLDRCIALGIKVKWAELAPLSATGFADVPVIALLAHDHARPALRWLLDLVLRNPYAETGACDLLLSALARVDGQDLDPFETKRAMALHGMLWSVPRPASPRERAVLDELKRVLIGRLGRTAHTAEVGNAMVRT
jgi:hypothetical protein